MKRLLALTVVCLAASAQASGFYFGDNGAKAMTMGGAFTAQADDLTAMFYNPAGLTQLRGFSFLADVQILRHQVKFSRQDEGWDPNNPSTRIDTVSSQTSPYFLPFAGVSYGVPIGPRTLTIALGLIAPPSQGRYDYPTPNYTQTESCMSGNCYEERPNKFAPQRYALVNTDILIAYPTLSVAFDPFPWLQIGASLQLTVSHFKQQQVLYGGDVVLDNPQRQLLENPDYDAMVTIDLPGQVGVTGILGVMVRPVDWLSFGASIRPPINFKARGKMTVDLPAYFTNLGASVNGDTATLEMTMPLEFKVGGRVVPLRHACAMGDASRQDCGLGINVDFVYQGWDSVKQLLLTPEMSLEFNGAQTPIAPFAVVKNWQPTFSVRGGASYRVFQYLSVSAGVLFETAAAQSAYYTVDWTHPQRVFVTGGVTGHLGPIDVIVGMHGTPTQTTDVFDGNVRRGQTSAPGSPGYMEPGVVNNGRYTSGGFGVILGVRGNFGGVREPARPIEPSTGPINQSKPAEPNPVAPPPPTVPTNTAVPES
ncbi:MAG: OmpP1/FadL family transporter [Archangium sp.]